MLSMLTRMGSGAYPQYFCYSEINWAPTVHNRMDAAATINFSVQSGAATIRERRLFRSERVQKFKSIIIINIDIIIQVQG